MLTGILINSPVNPVVTKKEKQMNVRQERKEVGSGQCSCRASVCFNGLRDGRC